MGKKTPSTDSIKITDTFSIREFDVQLVRTASIASNVFTKEYFLKLITPDELFEKRLSGEPGLVFKHGTDLYYTSIPKDMKFMSTTNLGTHMCANCGRLSALPDSQGGCKKVRERSMTLGDLRNNYSIASLTGSKRIEKYGDFIELGFESFNTTQDVFIVLSCRNRTDIVPHPKPSSSQAKALKESLVAFMEEDFIP